MSRKIIARLLTSVSCSFRASPVDVPVCINLNLKFEIIFGQEVADYVGNLRHKINDLHCGIADVKRSIKYIILTLNQSNHKHELGEDQIFRKGHIYFYYYYDCQILLIKIQNNYKHINIRKNIFNLIEQFSSLTSFFQAIFNHSCVQRKLGRHFIIKLIFISILDPQRQFVIRSVQYIKQGKSSHYSTSILHKFNFFITFNSEFS
ncbi:Protein of unknown function [Cotesia congregata]|uniref:Uncharacterized protein n=1 Tax=Cotesia congregata TaxID=51543 RepID=A0A8J2H9T7_COTCN|nr:Protein of unknown function [Cotesia congregata]